ncbi:FAD/NAD(P)-binding domain-containing protein [Pseudovirgaria hyperparasitica]|uniref:FAD/NAD(P)-binding domain-containing protein n=1 Tax=Pseudovirgaria hyperparasitica TaxID=470096 RepID=A0A6A6VW14_9PEZI|nr:FAD/NAD(P)-binding domain-containing protein [Pseudovirgaria hyperparasitica]KAF2753431.1 FAD/NAD(P)-binding domain-containing protein [Pseudovirgaria hyperparasitica]
MGEKNIVILGGSWAGINSAHYFLKNVLPKLPQDTTTYKVFLISPSSKYWHRVGGPRAIISKTALPREKLIQDIPSHFTHYPDGIFTFIEATATALDTEARTVNYRLTTTTSATEAIPYHALLIATGVSSRFAPFNHLADITVLESALDQTSAKIASASTIVIAGGGPAGVETAGEIASFKNGEPAWYAGTNTHPTAKITLLTSDAKLLPFLRPALAQRAHRYLARLGVTVTYNTRVESTTDSAAGDQTIINLSSGEQMTADLYIPALGVVPNTAFAPPHILTAQGKINSDKALRVVSAGPRVYAVGDVGAHVTRGGIMAIAAQVPVAMTNLHRDLLACAAADGDEKTGVVATASGPDRVYEEDMRENQSVPVGRGKAVGAFGGWRMPSFMLWLVKGRDYLLWTAGMQLSGKAAGESKWTPPKK